MSTSLDSSGPGLGGPGMWDPMPLPAIPPLTPRSEESQTTSLRDAERVPELSAREPKKQRQETAGTKSVKTATEGSAARKTRVGKGRAKKAAKKAVKKAVKKKVAKSVKKRTTKKTGIKRTAKKKTARKGSNKKATRVRVKKTGKVAKKTVKSKPKSVHKKAKKKTAKRGAKKQTSRGRSVGGASRKRRSTKARRRAH